MKSPLTGKAMQLASEWRQVPFRKETFDLKYQFYLCADTGEQFTTTELDELNMRMLQNLFRAKHHIPQPDEIKAIREQYELYAVKMGEVLGFGPNTYGLYEKGDLPSLPNANLLKMASDPSKFLSLAQDWSTDAAKAKQALLKRIEKLIAAQHSTLINFDSYLMGGSLADEYSGFKKPSLERLTEMVVYFAHEVPAYKTKTNKLLFYSDYGMFKYFGQSISGTRYKAIPYGPVPHRFESIFDKISNEDTIDIWYDNLSNGGRKEELKGRADRPFNASLFNQEELDIMSKVAEKFKALKAFELVNISHQENGWIENQESKSMISYLYAIDLKGI